MSIAEMFSKFLDNLAINNAETISMRYAELTLVLNKQFRDTESTTANTLQVGSFGRHTGIKGISDLDMLYIMPKTRKEIYGNNGQSKLLRETKEAILTRYPTTDVQVDRLVVTARYKDFRVEIQPVFEQSDGSFCYPDTKNGGSWKITKPREEMDAITYLDIHKNNNLKRLCKMIRAWKNHHGIAMGGLLIDTLAYNFLKSTTDYDTKSFLYYDKMSRDFFKYLSELPEQGEYLAPGSRQRVKVKKNFHSHAKKAHMLCVKAITAETQQNINDMWKKVYGRTFPTSNQITEGITTKSSAQHWDNTEEYIEDMFPVDIYESMQLDCEVKQNGFREFFLSELLTKNIPLMPNKNLRFEVKNITAAKPYEIYWKVLNRGDTARKKNCIRGQIIIDKGLIQKIETSKFSGDHIVECYCVKDGVVIAKDRIHVPIDWRAEQ